MVLYNSPLAVALLIAALSVVSVALLVTYAGFHQGLARLGSDPRAQGSPVGSAVSRLRRDARLSAVAVVGVVVFWVVLALASFHDAFDRAGPAFHPERTLEWRLRDRPPLETSFDRFQLPDSASQRERARSR